MKTIQGIERINAHTLEGKSASEFALNDGTIVKNNQNNSINGYIKSKAQLGYDTNAVRISNPNGGNFSFDTSPITGAIKIRLPVGFNSDMLRFTVKVYDYVDGGMFDVMIGGYTYAGTSVWINNSAYILAQKNALRNFSVRFGTDGTRPCVWIGELTSTWHYLQVFITDIQAGFSSNAEHYYSGWEISVVTSFGTIHQTITNTQIGV